MDFGCFWAANSELSSSWTLMRLLADCQARNKVANFTMSAALVAGSTAKTSFAKVCSSVREIAIAANIPRLSTPASNNPAWMAGATRLASKRLCNSGFNLPIFSASESGPAIEPSRSDGSEHAEKDCSRALRMKTLEMTSVPNSFFFNPTDNFCKHMCTEPTHEIKTKQHNKSPSSFFFLNSKSSKPPSFFFKLRSKSSQLRGSSWTVRTLTS